MYGVAHLAQIPMRAMAAESAEMVSQLLFGDAYQVLEESGQWLKIVTCDCHYEGWISRKAFNQLHDDDVPDYLKAGKYMVRDWLLFIREIETDITFPVFCGSSFPCPENNVLILGNAAFTMQLPENRIFEGNEKMSSQQVAMLRFASTYLNAPYLWGGRTPAGIDCSAFTQLIFKSIGLSIPRNASQQMQHGDPVDFITETQVGDLAFFQNEEGEIVHVGMICGKDKIIHSSGKVRIDKLDETGIFDAATGQYTHVLRLIKRMRI
ncbi:MAG: C40 family peptidase [Bacteroidales bacterium]|jgi:hypothetical protein|nr:C40 family peptidase [Bacteroidales bacterium]